MSKKHQRVDPATPVTGTDFLDRGTAAELAELSDQTVNSPVVHPSRQNEKVGNAVASTLIEGFVKASLDAISTGVPVSRLAGRETFAGQRVRATVDTTQDLLALYTDDLHKAQRVAKNAQNELLLTEDDDEDGKASLRERGASARSKVRELRAKIAELEQVPRELAPPKGPFNAFTSIIVPALAGLIVDPVVTAEENADLELMTPRFVLERRAGQLWGSATIRVNTTDGLADIGPIEWRVPAANVGVGVINGRVPRARPRPRGELAHLRRQMLEVGVADVAALTLANAPFHELPHVVLHELRGDRYPGWVSEQWREKPYANWVTHCYTRTDFFGRGGKFLWLSHTRQLLATYATQHESFRMVDLLRDVALCNVTDTMRSISGYKKHIRFQPSVELVPGTHHVPNLLKPLRGVRCECGRVAQTVCNAAEVPRHLLCECGRMPEAERHGMPRDVRFPDAYQLLRLPWEECETQLALDVEARREALAPREREFLRILASAPGPAPVRDLHRQVAMTTTNVGGVLDQLVGMRLAERDNAYQGKYTITALGRARARQAESESER